MENHELDKNQFCKITSEIIKQNPSAKDSLIKKNKAQLNCSRNKEFGTIHSQKQEKRSNIKERVNRLFQEGNTKQKKMELLRKEKEQKAIKECTFRPQIRPYKKLY